MPPFSTHTNLQEKKKKKKSRGGGGRGGQEGGEKIMEGRGGRERKRESKRDII